MVNCREENTLSTAAGLNMPLYQRHKHLQARIDEGTQAVIDKLNVGDVDAAPQTQPFHLPTQPSTSALLQRGCLLMIAVPWR